MQLINQNITWCRCKHCQCRVSLARRISPEHEQHWRHSWHPDWCPGMDQTCWTWRDTADTLLQRQTNH